MICILLNNDDGPGLWLARWLRRKKANEVKVISAEELLFASSFSCGFHNGQAFFSLSLQSGFLFSNTTVSTVLNRINYLPSQHLAYFKEEDRNYVQAEQQAIFTFLFSILPNPVFNSSSSLGLSGAFRTQWSWQLLAKRAGLSIAEMIYTGKKLYSSRTQSETFFVLVFGEKCYSQSPHLTDKLTEQLQRLRCLCSEKIIEVELSANSSGVFFKTATTKPNFTQINESFLHDLMLLF